MQKKNNIITIRGLRRKTATKNGEITGGGHSWLAVFLSNVVAVLYRSSCSVPIPTQAMTAMVRTSTVKPVILYVNSLTESGFG